jgi:hypothetical protein
MATTTTNFGWDIPQSTDLVKDGATAIAALGQDIDTSMNGLRGGTTGQVLSKTSGTDMAFTWVAQDDSNAIQNAIVDAKGDLIAATGADTPARLAVGTNGQVLVADSTASTGLAWATTSSGGMTSLASGSLSGSTVSLTGISSSYKNLQLVVRNIQFNQDSYFGFRINTSSSSIYNSVLTEENSNNTYTNTGLETGAFYLTYTTPCNYNSPNQSAILNIYDYASSASFKLADGAFVGRNNSDTYNYSANFNGAYLSTSAITSVQICELSGATFSSGTYELFGVK